MAVVQTSTGLAQCAPSPFKSTTYARDLTTENRSVGGSIPPLGTIFRKQINGFGASRLRRLGSACLAQR